MVIIKHAVNRCFKAGVNGSAFCNMLTFSYLRAGFPLICRHELLRFNVVLFVPSVDGLFVYVSENIFAPESVRCPFLGEYRTIAYHLSFVNRCDKNERIYSAPLCSAALYHSPV